MKSKVSEERLQSFIISNMLSYLHGEVSDKYLIDFLKILVAKEYMKATPRFNILLPKFQQLFIVMQAKDDRDVVGELIDEILTNLVGRDDS